MVSKVDTAVVKLWGEVVGAVSWLEDQAYGVFEYDRGFLQRGLDIAPIHMSLQAARQGEAIFSFPALNKNTFLGLPGMLADALPDKFGNRIIDAWLARNGRDAARFNPVERLCYTGKRAMGALEFFPAVIDRYDTSTHVEVAALVDLAQQIMSQHQALELTLGAAEKPTADALLDMLRVGTSAGGARPKAVIAMDEQGHVVSGQTTAPQGYTYWILKFDGVSDLELGEPQGYGRIEYAYYLMATAAGVRMTPSRLLEEKGRAHFMTQRFDRVDGKKLHMQSLCGIAHYDFNDAGTYSYEQVFAVMRSLRLSKADAIEQYRRMVFNIIARNQDDHTKNIAFLMGPDGQWKLAPAYDVMYSHNPAGQWTNQHQLSLNGKRDGFTRADLLSIAESVRIPKAGAVIDEVAAAVERWPEFGKQAGVSAKKINTLGTAHRLKLPRA
ncbi:MAG: type II toxin-antitoxin system HipA family toxin [Gammaproteobacteria bacterium]|nr:type II toxin-antitoxin system HipA family toxin [Gammaproteobacteria bacterium]